jgi:lipoyl(octanoyl) transferase
VKPGGLPCEWLGRVPYLEALHRQRDRRERVIARRSAPGPTDEVLWLLEHPPTLTTGRRSVQELDLGAWQRTGVDVVPTERGGLATWHGPGQLVGYLIVDVGTRKIAVKRMISAIEDGVIAWLSSVGVTAGRRCEHRGVWVGSDKIAAIGMHFRKGVSMHGFALNLGNSLDAFDRFTPCGITDGGVTTYLKITGTSVAPADVAMDVGQAVVDAVLNHPIPG